MTTQQLEVYLDTLNKDNDEENHQFILTHMDSPSSNVENACDSDYFIDQDGNYYIQNGEAATEQSNDAKSLSPCKPETATGNTQSVLVGKDEDDDIDFVFIMDNDKDADANANGDGDGDGEDDTAHAETDNYALDDADDPTYEIMDNDGEAASSKAGAKGANVIQCDSCSYTTHKRFLLSRHMQTHSDDRPHKCTVCERGFKTSITLINHVNTHLGNKPHACKTCGMCFTTSGELVRHVRYRHTGEKPHKCPECDYASVELSKLRRHIRCHTGERPYQCPHCTYASPDTFKLKRHMRTHTGEKPYECDICLSRFTQSNSLKAHKLIHSVGDKPVFQCTLCPTTCGRKTDLRMHIQNLHHSEKPVPCKRCGQEFPDRYTYKVHLKTHEGEKCFRCTICPYASSTMRHLESHMLVHTDQKPFTCTQCPKAFRQQQLLNRHVNLYHNTEYVPPKPRDKNHTCPHCDRAFTHKGGLMRHMATHDPKSTFHSEKMKLKLGRMTKITPDGSFRKTTYEDESTYNSDKDTDDGARERDDADTKEFIEVIEEQNEFDDTNTNEELDEAQSIEEPDFKHLQHSDGAVNKAVSKKFVSLQVEDGEDFMLVEVIRCEDDDDEENSIEDSATAIAESNTFVTKSSKDVENCFGFEEYSESYDSKKGLQIINLMN